jgi:membrane protease subunit HflK
MSADVFERIGGGKNPPSPLRAALAALALVLIVMAVWTSYYTVPAESEGVVLRLGRFTGSVPSGLHFKIPLGVDRVQIVPVKRQLKQEFGFGTTGASNPWQSTPRSEWGEEKSMVTGDLNAALVEWVVQYRIERPEYYLFKVRNADATLRDASESVMREVVGDRTVNEVLTVGRAEVDNQTMPSRSVICSRPTVATECRASLTRASRSPTSTDSTSTRQPACSKRQAFKSAM